MEMKKKRGRPRKERNDDEKIYTEPQVEFAKKEIVKLRSEIAILTKEKYFMLSSLQTLCDLFHKE